MAKCITTSTTLISSWFFSSQADTSSHCMIDMRFVLEEAQRGKNSWCSSFGIYVFQTELCKIVIKGALSRL